ncbi:carbohydrate ABC transporter permease [Pacificoceanicola onchidii]|uniref:carbohydrate ABC transporter permease n=1 Tax=Pacificoceanicola onchidii TaxID=2562685 RepID=UPI0019822777|nr:carbohydrate ABC transporter permease [Pacificoceanicola onchidii]
MRTTIQQPNSPQNGETFQFKPELLTLSRTWKPKAEEGRLRKMIFVWIALAVIVIFFMLPIAYLFSTSFKSPVDVVDGSFFPNAVEAENWPRAFAQVPLWSFMRNSILAAAFSVFVTLGVAVMATYAMLKLEVGKSFLPDMILASYVAPPIIALIPMFVLMQKLGLLNSIAGMVLIYGLMNVPVAFWLMRSFVLQVPKALDEAAWLDGASYFKTFFRVTLPLLYPAMIATGLICFILSFNELLFAQAMTFDSDSRTLPVGISLFQGERRVNFGQMAAASSAGIIPVYFIALFCQKWLIGGLTQGGVK